MQCGEKREKAAEAEERDVKPSAYKLDCHAAIVIIQNENTSCGEQQAQAGKRQAFIWALVYPYFIVLWLCSGIFLHIFIDFDCGGIVRIMRTGVVQAYLHISGRGLFNAKIKPYLIFTNISV